MAGMDRNTGARLDGWAHVQQSLQVLLTTPERSRVMRRAFGCGLPRRVDMPINNVTTIDLYADVAKAIADHEPRFRVERMSVDTATVGQITLLAEGVYYPRGHLGDFTVSARRVAEVAL